MSQPFVGVQLGAHSVFDEGVERCLDNLQESAGVNAVFVYSHTYQGYNLERKISDIAGDHGVEPRDPWGRKFPMVWARPHEEFYRDTFLRHAAPPPDGEFAGQDVFETLQEPAQKRGIKVYARVLEGYKREPLEAIPGWSRILSVDVYGRANLLPCWNHPAYRAWWLGTVEDLFKSYALAGLKWGSERSGPLSNLLGPAPWVDPTPTCFCEHCRARAAQSGVDAERARIGFTFLHESLQSVYERKAKPRDGVLVTVLRTLLKYPEILAWERLWHEAKESLVRQMFGVVKAINPQAEFGRHIWHAMSFDPIYRAATDYADLVGSANWLKPVVYHDHAAARLRDWTLAPMRRGVLSEIPDQRALELFYAVLGYDETLEPAYEQMSERGLSADYVFREIRRCVEGVNGQMKVYAGVGFDLPGTKRTDTALLEETIGRAYAAGADGMLLSREYDEMRLSSLRAAGRAIRAATNQE